MVSASLFRTERPYGGWPGKFVTKAKSELLSAVRAIAEQEGRQLPVLVEEALRDLIEKRRTGKPRADVIAAYVASHDHYKGLYEKLPGDGVRNTD